MSTAIRVGNSTGVLLRNVRITGFDKAIEVENSDLRIENSEISDNGIGVEARRGSRVAVAGSTFKNNLQDFVLDSSSQILLRNATALISSLDVSGLPGETPRLIRSHTRMLRRSRKKSWIRRHAVKLLALLESLQTLEWALDSERQRKIAIVVQQLGELIAALNS